MKRRLLVALALLATLLFAALGIWQIQRLAWKRDLVARVEARIHAPPTPLGATRGWPHLDGDAGEYRRVTVTGTFLHDRETLVQAVTARGGGFWVVTPLRARAGILLVNRGFVPPERRRPDSRAAGQVTRPVQVTGLMRVTEPEGAFLRANDPAGERWYSRDVAAIAAARGLASVAPFFVDADDAPNPGGYPIGGLTVVRFRNNHLVYAVTWFALAALGAFGAWRMLREPRRV